MSSQVKLSNKKDNALDEGVLEYLKISDSLNNDIRSKSDNLMLENLIDMFNYSYKVSEQWDELPDNFNLLDADLNLREESGEEESDSEYSDSEGNDEFNLHVTEPSLQKSKRPSFTDLANAHSTPQQDIQRPQINKKEPFQKIMQDQLESDEDCGPSPVVNLIQQSRKTSIALEVESQRQSLRNQGLTGIEISEDSDEDEDLILLHKKNNGFGRNKNTNSKESNLSGHLNTQNSRNSSYLVNNKDSSILGSSDSIGKGALNNQHVKPIQSQQNVVVNKDNYNKEKRNSQKIDQARKLLNNFTQNSPKSIKQSVFASNKNTSSIPVSHIMITKEKDEAELNEKQYKLHRGNTSISNIYDIDSDPSQAQLKSFNNQTTLNVPSCQSIKNNQKLIRVTSPNDFSKRGNFKMGSSVRSISSQLIKENKAKITYDDDGDKKVNQYRVITLLGKGAFGKVKLVECEDDKLKYAMKIQSRKKMKKVALKTGKDSFNMLQKEMAIMKKISHENLIQLIEIIDDTEKGKLYFIMDYMDLGYLGSPQHLAHLNCKKKYLPPDKLLKYFRHCLKGLDYLHNVARVIHFDIKPENILVNKEDIVKIADFGISKMMNKSEEFRKVGGTKMFLPPETWRSRKFKGKPIDIWALGITFYFLAFGKYPFNTTDMSKFNQVVETHEIKYPDRAEPLFVELIKSMTKKSPSNRITLYECMEHPWITSGGKFPVEKIDCEINQITVTKRDIANAMTINRLEVNLFALSKMKTQFTRQRSRISKNTEMASKNPMSLFQSKSKVSKKSNDLDDEY